MRSLSGREQVKLIALGYAAVVLAAAVLLFGRHLTALQDPISASGGMFAFGDALLAIFIACLFMVPTLFAIWVAARSESSSGSYAKFLVIFSLTAPACLSVFVFGADRFGQIIGYTSLYRMMFSPFVFAGMLFSRWISRGDRLKRLTYYALLVEGVSMAGVVAVWIRG